MQPCGLFLLLGIFPRHKVGSHGSFQEIRQIAERFRGRGWLSAGLLDHLVEQAAPRETRRLGLRGRRSLRLRQAAKNPGSTVNCIGMKVVHFAELQCDARQTDFDPHPGEHFVQIVAIDRNRAPSGQFGMQAAIGAAAEIPKDQYPKRIVRPGWSARPLFSRRDIDVDRTSGRRFGQSGGSANDLTLLSRGAAKIGCPTTC